MGDTSKVKPWERQPGESEKAYEAFCIYRDAGQERSINMVYKTLAKSRTLISNWSSRWKWVERVSAYDNDLERQAHREKQKLVADTRKRQLQIAMQLEKKALEALNMLKPEEMSPRDIKEMLRLATDIERKTLIEAEQATDTEQGRTTLADSIISAYEKRIGGGGK